MKIWRLTYLHILVATNILFVMNVANGLEDIQYCHVIVKYVQNVAKKQILK
jgi:hypothetical protein